MDNKNGSLLDVQKLSRIKCFVLDMDGTIYLGKTLFPFTPYFLEQVRRSGREAYYFTNNSSKNARIYVEKLAGMGITVAPDHMMISNAVIIEYLLSEQKGKTVYVLGTPELIDDFRTAGIPLDDRNPDIVVLGFDTTLTYEKLHKACDFIRGGCLYYGVNPDFNCPLEGGAFMPDCGSIARLIEGSTGRTPEFFGKPSRRTFDFIIKKTGFAPEEIAIVGDRLYTDIAVADGTPMTSILVLTGESTLDQALNGSIRPDMIAQSIEEIGRFL